MQYYVYIMSCTNLTLFYTGITNNIIRRVFEHKNKSLENSYTSRYNLNKLVYFEEYKDPNQAIEREKQIKKYSQKKKLELVQRRNPSCCDLYDGITDS